MFCASLALAPSFTHLAANGKTLDCVRARRMALGYAEFCRRARHDPITLTRARRQDPVIPHLVGSGRWNQRHESFDQLASLHQDVTGSIAPAGFEAECELTIRPLFESIVGERRPSHVLNQALQASAIACGYADSGVEAHASVRGDAGRGFGVCAQLVGVDTVPEASPTLAPLAARCNARAQGSRAEVREEWLLSGERVVVAVCAGFEKPVDSAGRARQDTRHLVVAGRGQGEEARVLCRIRGVGVCAVERQGVKVHVQVQRGSKPLDEADRAALAVSQVPLISRAAAEFGKERAKEGAQHLAGEPRVVRAPVAERIGQCQDPLADGHFGQNAVHQVRRGIRHAPAAARGAEAAPLAGEGNEAIELAGIAVQSQEAMRQHTAAEVGSKLLLDESGCGLAHLPRASEK
jgi:hypothetical protein